MSEAAPRASSAASALASPTLMTSLCTALIELIPLDPTTITTTRPATRMPKQSESFLAIDRLSSGRTGRSWSS